MFFILFVVPFRYEHTRVNFIKKLIKKNYIIYNYYLYNFYIFNYIIILFLDCWGNFETSEISMWNFTCCSLKSLKEIVTLGLLFNDFLDDWLISCRELWARCRVNLHFTNICCFTVWVITNDGIIFMFLYAFYCFLSWLSWTHSQ